jgi:hypothetical protein
MSRPRPDPVGGFDQPAETLVKTINAAHEVFQARHNWLSLLTSDEERRQFIVRCCEWWNNIVCPAMDTIGAVWNEQEQCFELPVMDRTK